MKALDRKLLRDVWRLRSQVLTIALVLACGISAFTGSLSAHDSLIRLRDLHYEEGRFAQVFVPVRRAPQRLAESLRAIDGVTDVQTTVVGSAIVTLPGRTDSLTARLIALPDTGLPRMNRLTLRAGAWLQPEDRQGLLVSEGFATASSLRPGAMLVLLMNGRRESFFVRGIVLSPEFIFAASRGGFSDDTRFGIFWANRAVLDAAYDMQGCFNYATLRVPQARRIPAVIATADRLLTRYGANGASGRDDQLSHVALTREIEEQRVYGVVFPAVLLGVALFLLHVMLSRHIATERLQVAALKALGYGNGRISLHYLGLVLLIVLLGLGIGTLVGVGLGQWLTTLYTRFFRFSHQQYWLPLWLPATTLLATTLAAGVATASAIAAIARLPPAEAMQPPSPARYRRSLTERLGWGSVRSPLLAMSVREISRRPVRAALTAVGIASAVAILVAGAWWSDAFDNLMHIEFGLRERADVILSLNEPRGPAVLQEIARLPGVIQSEGSRDLAVELRHGTQRLRMGLLGLDENARLHRALDDGFHPLTLLPGSLSITALAAAKLGVQPGDWVWVDPLEGTQPTQAVRVGAVVGNLVGRAAYAPRQLANHLAGEGHQYNSLRLRVAADQRDRLLQRLADLPLVAAAGDKSRLLAYFRSSTARNLLVFTGILSVFAAAIAVGIVYNSARIALAERAWELATLRVLGLTRAEVSQLLLGQLALQVAVALPLGFALGRALAALTARLIAGDQLRIPLMILPATYAYAGLVTLAAAVASALVVRRRVDQLDLVAVLKTRD